MGWLSSLFRDPEQEAHEFIEKARQSKDHSDMMQRQHEVHMHMLEMDIKHRALVEEEKERVQLTRILDIHREAHHIVLDKEGEFLRITPKDGNINISLVELNDMITDLLLAQKHMSQKAMLNLLNPGE